MTAAPEIDYAHPGFVAVNVAEAFTGIDPSGVADSATGISKALAALPASATSGQTAVTPAGTFAWATDVALAGPTLPSNTRWSIRGRIAATLSPLSVFPGAYVAYADAPGALQNGALNGNATVGGTSLSVALTTKPTVGHAVTVVHGASYALYTVVAVSGASSPWTVTLDRPVAFPFVSADVVSEYASWPSHVAIDGESTGTLTGTGDQLFEFARLYRGSVKNLDYDAAGGLVRSAVWGFDTGSRECEMENCSADLTGSTSSTGLNGYYMQSNERSVARRLRVSNAYLVGLDVLDCYASGAEDCHFYGCGVGLALSSLGVVNTQTSLGGWDCYVKGGSALDCTLGLGVGYVGPQYAASVSQFSATYCTTGITVAAGCKAARITDCDVSDCGTGFNLVAASQDTQVKGLRADGCTTVAAALAASCSVDGLYTSCSISASSVVSINTTGTVRGRNWTVTNSNAYGYGIQMQGAGGRVELDGAVITAGAGVGIYMASGTMTLVLKDVTLSASGGNGLNVNATGKAIIDVGCDFSGATTPVTITAGGVVTMVQPGGVASIAGAAGTTTMTFAQHYCQSIEIGNGSPIATGSQVLNALASFIGQQFVVRNYNTTGSTTTVFGVVIPASTTYLLRCNAAGTWEHVTLS
jgi:hypothetical protein